MEVDPKEAAAAGRRSDHEGKTYFFCSEQCRKTFVAAPESHLGSSGDKGAGPGHEHGHDRGGANAQDHGHRQASL